MAGTAPSNPFTVADEEDFMTIAPLCNDCGQWPQNCTCPVVETHAAQVEPKDSRTKDDASGDIQPTPTEERLARDLAQVHSIRMRGRQREWQGSLDVSWNERQAWYRVARVALSQFPQPSKSENVSPTTKEQELSERLEVAERALREIGETGWLPDSTAYDFQQIARAALKILDEKETNTEPNAGGN